MKRTILIAAILMIVATSAEAGCFGKLRLKRRARACAVPVQTACMVPMAFAPPMAVPAPQAPLYYPAVPAKTIPVPSKQLPR